MQPVTAIHLWCLNMQFNSMHWILSDSWTCVAQNQSYMYWHLGGCLRPSTTLLQAHCGEDHMLEEEETLTPVVASTALSMLRWWKFQKSVCPSCVKLFKMLVLGGVTILSYKEQYMPKGHQGWTCMYTPSYNENTYKLQFYDITLFSYIWGLLCGTDNIPRSIPGYSPRSNWMWTFHG